MFSKFLYKTFYLVIILFVALFSPKELVFSSSNLSINEFLAHPSSGNKEWVEFYNPEKTDLSIYWIDDDENFNEDSGSSSKKSLANAESLNSTYPYIELSSFLNNSGDYVVLFSQDGSIIDKYQYTSDPGVDVVIGRNPDGTGDMIYLVSSTKGLPNSHPVSPTPTPAPIPTNTPIPTPTQKPTSTPKPVSSSTPTPKSTTPSSNVLISIAPTVKGIDSPASPDRNGTEDEIDNSETLPTSILGVSVSNVISKSPKKEIHPKVLGASENNLPKILFGIGFLFFISCGILVFRKLKIKNEN